LAGPDVPPEGYALAFGNVQLGASSVAERLVVTNQDIKDPVEISQVGLAGTDPGDFRITTDNCSGVTVPLGGNCIVEVAFVPVNACFRSAVLLVRGLSGAVVVSLTGTGVDPADPTSCESPGDSTTSSETSASTTSSETSASTTVPSLTER
jgi:hypothetical protein